MWSWCTPKWDLSKSWDEFQGFRYMITIGLKLVWEPKNWYQDVSEPWIIMSRNLFWKKSFRCCSSPPSWASGSWRPSCSSFKSWRCHIHPKFLLSHLYRTHYINPKLKSKIFILFINDFSQNALWNLKPLNQPACQIWTPLHCEWNISVTMLGITKRLGYTIHRIHSYNWFKFEDLTPTGSDSRERQKVWHLIWQDL